MHTDLIKLLETYLEDGLPEQSVLEKKVSSVIGRQVTCYMAEDSVKIRIYVPSLFRGVAQRYLDAREIEEKLNGRSDAKYSYTCRDVIGGVNITIKNSPSKISQIQLVV